MDHDEVKQMLDNFTLRQSRKKLLSRKETVYQFGNRFDDGDGFRYSWPEAIHIKIVRKISEYQSLIVYAGQATSLKLRKDRISFSSPSSALPKNLPDELNELVDKTQSGIKLTEFDEFEIHRIRN